MISTSHLFVFPTTLFNQYSSWSFNKLFHSSTLLVIFRLLKTATLRIKRKLAAISRENHREHPRNSRARDTNVRRIQEDYMTQVLEEIEGRVTKSFPRSLEERRITFWTLSPRLTSLFWTHKSGFTPDPFRRHPGTQVEKTRNQLRIVPRMTLILKQGFLCAHTHKIAAQRMPMAVPIGIQTRNCSFRTLLFQKIAAENFGRIPTNRKNRWQCRDSNPDLACILLKAAFPSSWKQTEEYESRP